MIGAAWVAQARGIRIFKEGGAGCRRNQMHCSGGDPCPAGGVGGGGGGGTTGPAGLEQTEGQGPTRHRCPRRDRGTHKGTRRFFALTQGSGGTPPRGKGERRRRQVFAWRRLIDAVGLPLCQSHAFAREPGICAGARDLRGSQALAREPVIGTGTVRFLPGPSGAPFAGKREAPFD